MISLRQLMNTKQIFWISVLSIAVIFSTIAAISFGGVDVELKNIFTGTISPLELEVLANIRGPRVLLAAVVGAALGISGAALQGLFRNPLADPGLIGVSAGAALGAVSAIVFFKDGLFGFQFGIFLVPLASVLGSLIVIGLIFTLTSGFTQSGITYMLLVGIALNALATVGIGFLTFISNDSQLRGLTYWMMGSFGSANWQLLIPTIIIVTIAIANLFMISKKLDIIQLGEVEAHRLGINIRLIKMTIVLCSAFMIGACVSLSGIIGFIGLVVPHLVRLLGGATHTFLLPGSALLGVSISVLSDLFSRIVITPAELPVGLATSALGAPFFLWLIIRLGKN